MFSRRRPLVLHAFLLIAAMFAVLRTPIYAATLNVPSQYATIGAAVTAASSGDTIEIAPGTYSAAGDLNLQISKSLTFESSDGNPADTIVDCNQTDSFIGEVNSNSLSITFEGLTFQNCEETALNLDDSSGSTFTLDNCVLKNIFGNDGLDTDEIDTVIVSNCTANNNSADIFEIEQGTVTITNSTFDNDSNVILYANSSTGTVTNCTFANDGSANGNGPITWLNAPLTVTNTTFTNDVSNGGGGAITIDSAGINTPVTLDRCLFTGNSTGGYGGGCVLMFEGSENIPFTATDCVFLNNSTSTDGAVVAATSPAGAAGSITMTNCSFYGNSYTGGSASGQGTISADSLTPLTLTNCILYGDTAPEEISTANPAELTTVTFSDVHQAGYNGVNGNINSNPMYAATGSGDLHITNASPCVEAGTSTGAPVSDLNQYSWGTTVSMGAFSPLHFAFTTPSTATTGVSFPFTVTATAADDLTTITNYAGTVHFTSSDGAATLPADTALTNGTGSFNATLNTTGSQSITAADTSTTAYTSTSAGIAVSGPATHFVVSAPSPVTSNTPTTITITAEDASNNTATGYTGTVHLTSTDTGFIDGTGDSTLTAGTGQFNVTFEVAGTQTVTATDTVDGSITGTSNNVTVTPGATVRLVLSAASTATAGSSFNFTVTAQDIFGNTTPAYAGTVHFTGTDGSATLPADSTLANGIGTFSATFDTTGSQTITGTDTVTPSITGTSGIIQVYPGPATHFVVSAPSPVTSYTTNTVTVTAEDAFNNVDFHYAGTVNLTSTDPGFVDATGDSSLTAGTGQFNVTFKQAGTQTVTAMDTVNGAITGISNDVTVNPGPTVTLAITAPSTATAGSAFNFTVTAQDLYGNTTPAYTGTIHFTSSDGAATLPADSTLTAGTGQFSTTLKTAGIQTLTDTDTVNGSITGTSNNVTVSPAATDHLTISAPSTTTAGASINVIVTAVDQYGNTATGYSGTVQFTSTDAVAVLPANSTLTNGTGTFPATLITAGNQTVTATDIVDTSLTATTSGTAVDPAAATHFSVTAPSTITAGTSIVFSVTALDRFGNEASNYNGTIRISSSDLNASLPQDTSIPAGFASLNATLKSTGTQRITVTDLVNASITGTSDVILVTPAQAVSLQVIAPTPAISGVPFNVTVRAVDAYGNTATGYAGTVHFTAHGDPLAVLPADSTLIAGIKVFSATLRTPGPSETISATDTVTPSIYGLSEPITVTGNNLRTFSTGWQMISAPADYTGFTMSQIFSPAPAAIDAWNASTMSYAVAPTAPADTIRPGIGYWVDCTQSTTLLDIGLHTDPTKAYTVALSAGWNMIGDPFNVPVNLATGVTITTTTVDAAPFYYATHNGLLLVDLYTFPAGASAYTVETSTLQPYAGYWIYAYIPCTLSISTN